jgi:glycosyltransferase involved in cell wall biosynthesis
MRKIIFIHNNYEPDRFLKTPDKEDRYYTYGFGSHFARNFKFYYPDYNVEMWRLDSYTKNYNEKTVQGVRFRIYKSNHIHKLGDFSRRFVKELKKEVKATDPILFISHTHTWLLYQIAFFFPGSRIITSHHGDWSPFYKIGERHGIRKVKDHLDTRIEKKVFKNINYFLVCDTREIPYIQKANPHGKIELFSTGIDINSIYPVEKNRAREILGWDKNKKYILYLGKLYKYKQAKELIDIWKELKREDSRIELIIIGNSDKDEYYQYARDSGAQALGRVLNKDLNIYYSAADVYVLLSLREDYFGGIGIAPLESLACNTPVVSFSLRNYIGNNVNEIGEVPATLEDYKNKVLKVINHPENYKNMRDSIKTYYSYEAIALKMGTFFKELL